MSRLRDIYHQIVDFVLRRKFENLLDQLNKLDLDVDKINKLKSIVFAEQGTDPDEVGEIQLNTDSETGLEIYLNGSVWTFLFLEHFYALYGHMSPEIYPVDGLNFPVFRKIAGAAKIAGAFPKAADAGWSGAWQVSKVLDTYNLGLVLEFHAVNATGTDKAVTFICTGRVVAVGEGVDAGGTPFNETLVITVPDGSTEVLLQSAFFPLVDNSNLTDDDMMIVESFYRDVDAGGDTLDAEILLSGWKPYWTNRVVSPVF